MAGSQEPAVPEGRHGDALARILRELAAGSHGSVTSERLPDVLVGLPGSDLTTLLLEVFRRRASRLTPAEVMRRYGSDRFVAPVPVSVAMLRRAEDAMLTALLAFDPGRPSRSGLPRLRG